MSQFNIQVASKLTGLSIYTLRAWEKRYKVVEPQRLQNGRRLYSDSDIEKLILLNELCTLGHNIGSIAHHDINGLKELLEKLGKKLKPSESSPLPNMEDISVSSPKESLKSLQVALQHYKLDIISHEINKLKIVSSYHSLVFDLLVPLLKEVGMKVYRNEFDYSQEAALTSIIKFHVGHIIYRAYEKKSRGLKNVIITAPEGSTKEFGPMLSCLLCAHYNINFYYLGVGLPASSVAKAAKALKVDHLLLYSTQFGESSRNEFESYLDGLTNLCASSQKILVVNDLRNLAVNHKKLSFCSNLNDLDLFLKTKL